MVELVLSCIGCMTRMKVNVMTRMKEFKIENVVEQSGTITIQ